MLQPTTRLDGNAKSAKPCRAAPNLTRVSLMSVITWHKSEVSGKWKAGGMGLQALETRFPIGLAEWPAPPPPKRDS
jgi:hypothetical protein